MGDTQAKIGNGRYETIEGYVRGGVSGLQRDQKKNHQGEIEACNGPLAAKDNAKNIKLGLSDFQCHANGHFLAHS
jgi:hypothetical protein